MEEILPAQADAVSPWTSPNTPALCLQGELKPGAVPAQIPEQGRNGTEPAGCRAPDCSKPAAPQGAAWMPRPMEQLGESAH